MLNRKAFLSFLAAGVVFAGIGTAVQAHHGWSWTDSGDFKLVGVIERVRLGNPHGQVWVDAEGEKWLVEVGQPWRNERAGLTEAMFAKGKEMTAIGERSADKNEKRMKAEIIVFDGKEHVLYPDRI